MTVPEQTRATIADYVGDMVALQDHIEAALDRQLALATDMPVAHAAIQRFHDMVKAQRDSLKRHQETLGSTPGNPIKEAGAALFGAAAGVIDKVRTEAVSKALRDDYTAFNHAAIGYTMLHATASALGDDRTAQAARDGLTAYARAIQDINHLIAEVVVHELRKDDHAIVDQQAPRHNRRMIDLAWSETRAGTADMPGGLARRIRGGHRRLSLARRVLRPPPSRPAAPRLPTRGVALSGIPAGWAIIAR